MAKTLTIDGARIHDIPTFYDEINRIFMTGEDWVLGPSLDALDDLFYGGYGALKDEGHDGGQTTGPVRLVWTEFARMASVLGFETTRAFLAAKLDHPDRFDPVLARRKLEALEAGTGQTYLDIVLEIIAAHPNIRLAPE